MSTTTTNESAFPAIAAAARTISAAGVTGIQDFATAMTARATRLTAVRARLAANANTPPATLANLDQNITASSSLASSLGALATRIAQRPTVDPADLAIFGTAVAAPGATPAAVWVRLTGNSGVLKIGSRVQASASGDFSLVYKSCEIPAGTTNLQVVAEDANGAQLGAVPVTPKAGSPACIQLTLANSAASSTAPAQKTD